MLTGCNENVNKEQIKESLKEETLNVENDTFTFIEIVDLVGQNKSSLSKLAGEGKSGKINTSLFGEKVTIDVEDKEDKINVIRLTFEDVNQKPLISAISEQLGKDGKEEKEKTKWSCEKYTIELSDDNQHCIVTIK